MIIDKSLMLNEIKSHLGYSKDAQFARYLGISPQTLSSWHARNTFDIHLLYAKCIFLEPEWLITGQGQMLRKDNPDTEKSVFLPDNNTDDYWRGRYDQLKEDHERLLEELRHIKSASAS